MYEGKHIHFSPTDNKPLCSYSGKLCRQRRLNGYAFCIRHILEDHSAPFKQCSYVTRNNSQKCLNAIPTSQDRGYCHSHMQVVGIIPKTERKTKIQPQPVSKADNSSSSTTDKLSSPTLTNAKKDPGAVFKFEEESSEVADVFSYKNGLSAGSINGKGKTGKLRDRDVSYNSSKDSKNVKPQNGCSNNSTASFTTKRITDKNKNVYTAIIPTSSCVNNNTTKNKVYPSKTKSTCWSNATTDAASVGTRNHKAVTRIEEGELKNLHDDEEIHQFEQLKTLKQLDKSSLTSDESIDEGYSGNAKLQVFPRLAVPKHKLKCLNRIPQFCSSPTSSSPVTNHHNIPDDTKSQSCTEKDSESEIASTTPPPLITHSNNNNNNSIIVKTELPQAVPSVKIEPGMDNASDKIDSVDKNYTFSDRCVRISSGINNNYSNPIIATNDHCNSIEKDFRNRHEFLAHVRHSFKSQYKSIKKSCKFSEKNGKQKLRNSLMRCVRIDSSVCAQVLMGYGITLPTLCSPIKIETEGKKEVDIKIEHDDYEFVDNEAVLPVLKNDNNVSEQKSKKGKGNCKANKTGAIRTSPKRSSKRGKELDTSTLVSEDLEDKKDKNKGQSEVTKESKLKGASLDSVSKRKLKRSDALLVSPETSLGSSGLPMNENITSSNNNTEKVDISIAKKQKLELNVITPLETELGLTLNEETSHDDDRGSADHQNLTQTVGKAINDSNHDLHDILGHSQLSSSTSHRNQGLETVLNSVGSSENAGTPDGVITDASFDSTFEHSTSSQPECEFSEDDLEHSFELQIDPEIESQASRLLEDNVLTEADFTELFPDNRMSDHKFGRNDLQELGMTGLEFDVNDIDYSLFANIFPNFPRTSQPESISISNQF